MSKRDTKYERLIFKLETKYRHELDMPEWSEYELSEMGEVLDSGSTQNEV